MPTRAALPSSLLFDPALDELIADYEQALRAEGRSPRTIEWYGMFLREFCRFAGRAGRTLTLHDLSPPATGRG